MADAHIAQSAPTFNYGAAADVKVTGVALNGWEAGLVRFDPAAIQTAVAGGVLQSASLQLTLSSASLGWGTSQVVVSRMNMPWSESGATWLCANDTDHSTLGKYINNCTSQNGWGIEWWSFLPRPYAAQPTASVSLPFGQTGVVSADVTPDVLAALTGAQHYGWFLSAATNLSSVWVRFFSRTGSAAPKLVLTVIPACTATGPDTDCDGIDDDCNGVVDDAYAATTTQCGIGACSRTGRASCVNGSVANSCVPGTPAANDTSCNGVDDNCNGSADEGYVAVATSCGVRACARTGSTSS
ncbi:MAG: hypothetical protein RL701_2468 [Pseudomonadota bacterium]